MVTGMAQGLSVQVIYFVFLNNTVVEHASLKILANRDNIVLCKLGCGKILCPKLMYILKAVPWCDAVQI